MSAVLREMPYQSVSFYPEASHGFVAQLYSGSDSPTINDSPDESPPKKAWSDEDLGRFQPRGTDSLLGSPSPGDLVLTVLMVRKTKRNYQSPRNAIPVYELVCMDGDQGCIKCRLNSGLSTFLVEEPPVAGCTVIIKSFSVMRMTFEEPDPNMHCDMQKRCLLFVKDIRCKSSPYQERQAKYDAEGSPLNYVEFDSFRTVHVDQELLNFVMDNGALSLASEITTPYEIEDGYEGVVKLLQNPTMEELRVDRADQFEMLMTDKYVAAIVNRQEDNKLEEYKHIAKKAKFIFTEYSCDCCRFGYEKCVADMLPLKEIDTIDLFRQINRRLYGRVTAASWEDLSNRQKRWALYWSYAVNVFHMRTADSERLPRCFEEAVHKAYPDPNGKYTGFKGREERKAEQLLKEGGISKSK